MKKILMILLIILILMFFLTGCHSSLNSNKAEKNNKRNGADSTVQNNLPKEAKMKITMTSEKSTYPASTEKVDVIITNNTSIEYFTGDEYSIEYFDGSVWKKYHWNLLIMIF